MYFPGKCLIPYVSKSIKKIVSSKCATGVLVFFLFAQLVQIKVWEQ